MKVTPVLDKRIFEEIRSVALEQGERDPDNAFHIISNLNWYRYVKQIESAVQFLPTNGKVLDIGCGWGQTTAMLAASCPDLEVIGIDIVEAESWIKFEQYGAQFGVCNALTLPFGNEFDAVTAFGVMEHTDNEERFLSEVNRVLKSGGILFIANLPNRYALSEWLARVLGIWNHERKYTLEQIRKLFKSTGFSIAAVGRESLIPAQVDRISKRLGGLFNRHYLLLDRLDSLLMRTPLAFFAESWAICAQKASIRTT